MKKLLLMLTLGLFILVGCETGPPVVDETPTMSFAYVEKTTKWCQDVVDKKAGILSTVQIHPDRSREPLENMKKASEIAELLDEAGYDDLADVLYNISSASSELSLYIDTKEDPQESAKHFMKAKQFLDAAEEGLK